jgi:hypothetical protein
LPLRSGKATAGGEQASAHDPEGDRGDGAADPIDRRAAEQQADAPRDQQHGPQQRPLPHELAVEEIGADRQRDPADEDEEQAPAE